MPILWLNLFGRVNVVNIERPEVIEPAGFAFTAKLLNKIKFAFPVARPFVRFVTVLIPVITIALSRAKSVVALFSTLLALPFFAPPLRQITCPLAILAGSVCDSVRVGFKRRGAMSANNVNLCVLSHVGSCVKVFAHYTPKYFDIACERIENAYRQSRLFA